MNEEIQPGKYYLGDPSFVLSEEIYSRIWGHIYNYENGKFSIYGKDFAVHSTHYGDGIYYDNKKRTYGVDAGVIGLVSLDLIDDNEEALKKCDTFGTLLECLEPFYFIYDAGIFYIRCDEEVIEINTRSEEDYLSDCEEHCYNSDGEKIENILHQNTDANNDVDNNADADNELDNENTNNLSDHSSDKQTEELTEDSEEDESENELEKSTTFTFFKNK
jgi:hypothetical protein